MAELMTFVFYCVFTCTILYVIYAFITREWDKTCKQCEEEIKKTLQPTRAIRKQNDTSNYSSEPETETESEFEPETETESEFELEEQKLP